MSKTKKPEPELTEVQARRAAAYLRSIPKTVPPGLVVVHNHVRPTRRLGSRGFRAWLAVREPAEYKIVRCPCSWAPELETHYRVNVGK